MPKSTDIPTELREFNKIFERFAYRFDAGTLFDDYLTYCIEVFNVAKTGEPIERLKKHYGEYYPNFIDLFREHVNVQAKMVDEDGKWYDLLGTFYECLRSSSKASSLGQFFTPPALCDMMAQMQGAQDMYGKGLRINDPACGSGRTLLAFHVKAPGNFLYGEDLDPMCTKMCAINMVIHGVVGEASNMDTLKFEWRFGYQINTLLNSLGLVGLKPMTKEEAFVIRNWEQQKAKPEVKQPEPEPQVIQVGKNGQANLLGIFE